MYDILIIGGGPAGLSAAVGARSRGKSCVVLTNPAERNPLGKAPVIHNYLGMPDLSGREMMEQFTRHAETMGAELVNGRVLSVIDMGQSYFLTCGDQIFEGKKLILAGGVSRGVKYPNEEHLVGHGVSYCATCDGMLYRKKSVVVMGTAKDAPQEANYLQQIGCQVTFAGTTRPRGLSEDVAWIHGGKIEILGENTVEGVLADGARIPCEGVFILRETVAPNDLFPELELENGHIKVNRNMETNLRGIYAAGDCTGKPLQIAKAVGEGLIAGENAAEALENESQKG